MGRALGAIAICLLSLVATSPGRADAAMDVVVTVSPARVAMGDTVEVLLRTFVPIALDDLAMPTPSGPYPVPSGFWAVLYPFPDYPFRVIATAEDGSSTSVTMALDRTDVTLWRGSFTPCLPGAWTVTVANFSVDTPGATADLVVSDHVETTRSAVVPSSPEACAV